MVEQNVEGLAHAVISRHAEQGFRALVVARPHEEGRPGWEVIPSAPPRVGYVDDPSTERPGCFVYVSLRVVARANRVEFHHLSSKVLVDRSRMIEDAIEVGEHDRVDRNGVQEIGEIAGRMLANRLMLLPHGVRNRHFPEAGCKVIVPKPRHTLLDESRRGSCALDPRDNCREHIAKVPSGIKRVGYVERNQLVGRPDRSTDRAMASSTVALAATTSGLAPRPNRRTTWAICSFSEYGMY